MASNREMFFQHAAEDRRRYDQQIRQSYIVTMVGVFTVVLLWYWVVAPLLAPSVWPLLDLPVASHGRKAPEREGDLFVSVRPNGDIFLDEYPARAGQLVDAFSREAKDWRGNVYVPEVFVRADRAAPFGAVRAVIRAAQAAGRPAVVFLAAPRNPESLLHPAVP